MESPLAFSDGRSRSAKAAASPMEMPSRAASKGRHGAEEDSCSEWNPYRVVRQSESVPPTRAASMRPDSIMRLAAPNTLALDAHAEDTAKAGPSSRQRRRM